MRLTYNHFTERSAFDRELLANTGLTDVTAAAESTENGFYYAISYIKDTKEIYTHGQFYGCAEYDDSALRTLISDLQAEVAENEFVAATALTALETNKADKSEIPDVSNFALASDLGALEADVQTKASSEDLNELSQIVEEHSDIISSNVRHKFGSSLDIEPEEGVILFDSEDATIKLGVVDEYGTGLIWKPYCGIEKEISLLSIIDHTATEYNVQIYGLDQHEGQLTSTTIAPATATTAGVMSAAQAKKLNNLPESTYSTEYINTNIISKLNTLTNNTSAMFKFRGSVYGTEELPQEDNSIGDVYYVTSNGSEYVWISESANEYGGFGEDFNYGWLELGPIVSGYAKESDLQKLAEEVAENEFVAATALTVLENNKADKSEVEGKQDKLVSGTTIKTINGQDILGSGDIVIESGASLTESDIAAMGFTKNTGTYSKPSAGIPKSDLASDVQTSLGKADTALQSIPDNYMTSSRTQDFFDNEFGNWEARVLEPELITIYDTLDAKVPIYTSGDSVYAEANGVADEQFVYALPSSANGDEDDIIATRNTLKTINGESLIGSGNIEIKGGESIDTSNLATKDELAQKQDIISDIDTIRSNAANYQGTVTSVRINGQSKSPSSGVVDLGYINKQLLTSTSSSMTLAPNIYYRNTSTSLSTLTIMVASASNNNIINEYFVEFTTSSSGTTVSLPSTIK